MILESSKQLSVLSYILFCEKMDDLFVNQIKRFARYFYIPSNNIFKNSLFTNCYYLINQSNTMLFPILNPKFTLITSPRE